MGIKRHGAMDSDNKIIMPNFMGIPFFQALNVVEKMGLKTGTVSYHEQGNRINIVLKQSIAPGEEIEKGTKIHFDVSGKNLIRHLPSIYKKFDKKNDNFLMRFLWIFQHMINSIFIKLDNLETYFNPLVANKEFFRWLASWFAVDLQYEVSEEKMRHLVKDIVLLYKWRGTAIGLAKYLEIVTGVKPEIYERDIPENEYVIRPDKFVENPIYDANPSQYNFVVSFPVSVKHFDTDTVKKIHQIIKLEKPAHTHYYVVFKEEKDKKERDDFSVIGSSAIR